MRSLAWILSMILLMNPTSAHGDECSGLVMTPKATVVQGVEGVWLPTAQSACLTKRAEEAQKLRETVEALDALNEKLTRQSETSAKALEAAQQLVTRERERGDEFKVLAAHEHEDVVRLQDELDAWYRSPVLWVSVGAGATALVIILGVVASSNPVINVQQ